MAPRLLVSVFIGAILLVPIALFWHPTSNADVKPDILDAAFYNDAHDGGSLSLLQTSAAVHLSTQKLQHVTSFMAFMPAGIDMKAAFAEYVAMTLFVIIGCGSAMGVANQAGYAWVLQVALTFGIAISVLAYSIGHISGGQINCAVTFALAINGSLGWGQAFVNLILQLLGSITGALILSVIYPREKDLTGNLASNRVGEGWSPFGALVGETVGTFILCFTVLNTAVDAATAANRPVACLAIGLSVFLAHSVLIPIDGCSINPTRSFGPALVAAALDSGKREDSEQMRASVTVKTPETSKSTFSDMWIFWLGPLTGAALAVGVYQSLN